MRRNVQAGDEGSRSLSQCYADVLSPSAEMLAEEHVHMLESAFDALPEHYREVIALSRLAKLSRFEVARQLGRSEASVRNLLHRALVALAEEIDRRDDDNDCY